ncbi:hypothetical protein HanIR_Chr09g0394671 [Helianthus annuus]|nr:hypothetical protein HanIR_Chr09g0394671 [Helianthus annuus]
MAIQTSFCYSSIVLQTYWGYFTPYIRIDYILQIAFFDRVFSPCCYSPIKTVIHRSLPTKHFQQYHPKCIYIGHSCKLSGGKITWIKIPKSAFDKCADMS